PKRREIVSGRPIRGGEFLVHGKSARFERLEGNRTIGKIVEANDVEIRLTYIHRQVLAPIILDAFERDVAALLETPDLIGARTEGRIERRFLERMTCIIGSGKD